MTEQRRGPLDAVLFDLDGTLADSMHSIAEALAETLAEQGYRTSPEELMPHFGPDMQLVFRRAVGVDEAEAERLYALYLPTYYERYMPDTPPLPGADELIDDLAARLPLGIVTSKLEAGARSLIANLGWSAHFSPIVGRDTTGIVKPRPEPLLHALAELDIEGERAAYVGDTEEDMQAALAAGIAVRIGITEIRSEQQLREAGATAICHDLFTLRALLVAVIEGLPEAVPSTAPATGSASA
ncbi:MAG: HAD family hydrolase [Chloroflexi bacterium]|nr:HAD family hydrolase [Chloroflexota bacterium]